MNPATTKFVTGFSLRWYCLQFSEKVSLSKFLLIFFSTVFTSLCLIITGIVLVSILILRCIYHTFSAVPTDKKRCEVGGGVEKIQQKSGTRKPRVGIEKYFAEKRELLYQEIQNQPLKNGASKEPRMVKVKKDGDCLYHCIVHFFGRTENLETTES